MESCYIPNNPQYGLSLEYTAFNNGASFSGTITGFPANCDTIAEGVLCCGGDLQPCNSCNGSLGRLRHCDCHSSCSNRALDSLNRDLEEYNTGLDDCSTRLGCETLDNCDNSLVDCEGRLVENDNSLTNCDSRLGVKCDGRAVECDNGTLVDRGDCIDNCEQLIEGQVEDCGDELVECDGRFTENCSEENDPLGSFSGQLDNCDDQLDNCDDRLDNSDGRLTGCDRHLGNCESHLDECGDELEECGEGRLDGDRLEFEEYRDLGQSGPVPGAGYWIPDEMASCSFSLPPLDLDPLPSLFPFSPCSGNYKGELKEKQPHEVADVLLSLKHAVVHPGAELGSQYSQQDLTLHPQMVMGGAGCYEPCGGGVFPTMSVNVSMNMTMHGYPGDQMCPQMQWGQNSSSPMNMMYSQNQGVISPAPYPGSATYSFTADFRAPSQSDPLITATSSFKPIQITASNPKNQQGTPNYSIFSQKSNQTNFAAFNPSLQKQPGFGSPTLTQMKTRSAAKLQIGGNQLGNSAVGPTYQILGGQGQNHINNHGLGYPHLGGNVSLNNGNSINGGKVQIGSLSNCSESEDEQKPNLCRICGKTYARPSTLKTHLRTHSGERPYRCSDCNKSFSQAANLTAHVRTHTGQKPFSCQICHRRFSQSSSVTTHMRTHSGERPYRCRACKKAFSDSSTLTKHLRIHSGEKPYQCKLCFLRFSQSGNLNRHMRVHGNNAALLG